jgi:hypothetical protein
MHAYVINVARRYNSSFKVHDHPLNPNPRHIILPPPSRRWVHALAPRRLHRHRVHIDTSPIASLTTTGSTPCARLDAVPPPPPSGLCRCLPNLLHAVGSPTIASYRGPPHSLPLSIICHLENWFKYCPFLAYKLIQVFSICRLGTDSSIFHLLLRKLIQVLSICLLGTDSSIVHLSLRNWFKYCPFVA